MPDLKRFFVARRLALGAFFVCAATAPAMAQTAGANNAPNWLEQRVQGLEKSLAFFGQRDEDIARQPSLVQPAQSSMADVAVRLDRLENQMRQLNGRLEELEFQGRKNEEGLKRFQGDVDYRFQDLEGKGGGGGGGGGGSKPQKRGDIDSGGGSMSGGGSTASVGSGGGGLASGPRDLGQMRSGGSSSASSDPIGGLIGSGGPGDDPNGPMSIRPPGAGGGSSSGGGDRMAARVDPGAGGGGMTAGSGGPNDQYALGVGFVQRRDYDQAEATFRDFLRQYPNDTKAAEARYWLGESLYQRKKYEDAADSFLTIYTNAPQSAKAPESMVKLGLALNGMGKKDEACATLDAAGKKYSRIKATSDREFKRISC